MNRRAFLTATTAAATVATARAVAAATVPPLGETGVPQMPRPPLPLGPLPDSRYPDPHVKFLVRPKGAWGNPGFPAFAGTMAVERVATGFRGGRPGLFPGRPLCAVQRHPNNRIMRFSEDDGHVSVFREPSMNSNGNTIDREGRLITCEHSGRRVTRTELDGSITAIADKYNGKRLNSPNDTAVASDGSSGSPIRSMASAAITKASNRRLNRTSTMSTGSIRNPATSKSWSTTSSSRTGSPFRRTRKGFM